MARSRERSPWPRRLPFILLLPICAGLQLGAARFTALADLWATRVYPFWARILDLATGWAPFSVAEPLGIASVIAGLVAVARTRPLRRRLSLALANFLAAAGILYAAFLPWGVGYARSPLAARAGYDTSPAALEELGALADELAERANAARGAVGEDGAGVMRLAGSPKEALARGRLAFAEGYVGRAKGFALFSPLLSRLGASGIFVMVTGEPTVNTDLPAPSLPFVVCHELAHQVGWAREEEASFVGYLACARHPDADFRYSAELAALDHALSALRRADPTAAAAVEARCTEGIRRDRAAERDFWRRYRSPVSEAAGEVYDVYLRSQGQAAGRASYGLVVDLLIAERRLRTRDRSR